MMRDSSTDGCVNFYMFQHVIQQWVQAVKQQRRLLLEYKRMYSDDHSI